ncbi:uncharacterized protein LOC6553383 [Drosophila erecta]|uniref:GG19884 n=1 Tax=Drosophila erecta TaxID=7220 RepID=B3P139_DROER|nr:uncharacterized protein LOC6553383 [Drosophila erecta]EDV49158.1 uncharacterized protein Dere_GG19884 [Drosophila erecta]
MSGRRYVRPNKLQGNCVTCRNFHSALSNAIRNRWTCCNINLTFYGPGQGLSAMRPQSSAGQRLTPQQTAVERSKDAGATKGSCSGTSGTRKNMMHMI